MAEEVKGNGMRLLKIENPKLKMGRVRSEREPWKEQKNKLGWRLGDYAFCRLIV